MLFKQQGKGLNRFLTRHSLFLHTHTHVPPPPPPPHTHTPWCMQSFASPKTRTVKGINSTTTPKIKHPPPSIEINTPPLHYTLLGITPCSPPPPPTTTTFTLLLQLLLASPLHTPPPSNTHIHFRSKFLLQLLLALPASQSAPPLITPGAPPPHLPPRPSSNYSPSPLLPH